VAAPRVIPVFIPQQGCPHACLFCNQERISGAPAVRISGCEVAEIIRTWLGYFRDDRARSVQVAFYGGSFTGLAEKRQRELLGAAGPFLDRGEVQSIRLSTRPDYIDPDRLALLAAYRVRTVELGVQSLDDTVLAASRRGHTSQDVARAVHLLRTNGFQIGLQMMVGLPGQNRSSLRATVERLIRLAPDFVRIYPLLVIRGSGLARQYEQGRFQPLSLDMAVLHCAWMKEKLTRSGIRIVRMGLQPGPELERSLLAGPYHPSFGHLVDSRLMLHQVRGLLAGLEPGQCVVLTINPRDVSLFQGMGGANRERLTRLGLSDRFRLRTDPGQPRGTVRRGRPENF
jgi:histone acetyltransferase (RNA polymerase elongator complex component)